jgi:hypothetical protein
VIATTRARAAQLSTRVSEQVALVLLDQLARRLGTATQAPPVPATIQDEMDAMWRSVLATVDLAAVRADYQAAGELVVLRDLVPRALCERALAEIDRARPTRSRVPFVRAAQHVGWRALQRIAPLSAAIYKSPVFLDWMTDLVGRPLQLKDPEDDHACATYEYERKGDGMQFHYDTCGCDDGASFTQLLSLHDRSSQRLMVDLHTTDGQPVERRTIQTLPGTLVVFCGSKVWHGVSPLGHDERRVILSMSYATDASMPPWTRLYENLKDAILYFGPSALLQRNFK